MRTKYGPSEATFCATFPFGSSGQTTPLTVAVADAADSAYQMGWLRAYLPTEDSKRLEKEDSSAPADQPNLVDWRRAYLPIAECNVQRARPFLRTRVKKALRTELPKA